MNTSIKKSPVVVVLGHIDHGKTTLLDAIRKTNVTAKEAGGITQSIGAYQVSVKAKNEKRKTEDQMITFIDTPGHEAFQKMRSHGAKAADIALLVVAADEGVKPQTIEALGDIKSAALPFIVVVNKIDKPEANPEKVKQELAAKEVMVEGWGGEVPVIEVSATKGKGIKELLDLVLLLAHVEEIHADAEKSAEGIVIASELSPRRGILVTLIVKDGTLRQGDWVRLESTYGKIKFMEDFTGTHIREAGPSTPVLVLGAKEAPEVGELFAVVGSEVEAKQKVALEKQADFPKALTKEGASVLKLIVKAKENASLDAITKVIRESNQTFPGEPFHIIDTGLGEVSTSDVDLAEHFGAIIVCFQVNASQPLKNLMKQHGVSYQTIDVIYHVKDAMKAIFEERIKPQKEPQVTGELLVLATFASSKKGQVIGGRVANGAIRKNALFGIERNDALVGQGKTLNLQQDKKDVGLVEKGKECGLFVQSDLPIAANDILIFSS